jgi:UDP-N-acetylmuramoylalanine--D-glutamate ligase
MAMETPWSKGPWRRAVVYGLGLSGRAAVRFLRRRGVEVVAYDLDRRAGEELAGEDGVSLRLGADPTALPRGVDGVVVSPGIPLDRPLPQAARRAGLPVIAEVELAFPFLEGPVVAITGSNGKSTTTAMAGAMLEAAGLPAEVCGNIGRPLCDVAEGPAGRIFVVELSSFQLESVDHFRPGAAALLNLSPDHLDRHPDFAAYQAAKMRIFRRQGLGDLSVLGAQDPRLHRIDTPGRRRFFTSRGQVADGCQRRGDQVLEISPGRPERELFRVGDIPLPGDHNLENAMAAALLVIHHGVKPEAMARGLRDFRGLPHRLERVRERSGVLWYDDSKGTNLAATVRSLDGFPNGTVHLILGGRFKGGDLAELRRTVARKARRVYLVGEAAEVLGEGLSGIPVEMERVGTLERAVCRAAELATEGEVVLLSPACSSFDQFTNFAERGRIFQRLVNELPAAPGGGAHGP